MYSRLIDLLQHGEIGHVAIGGDGQIRVCHERGPLGTSEFGFRGVTRYLTRREMVWRER